MGAETSIVQSEDASTDSKSGEILYGQLCQWRVWGYS